MKRFAILVLLAISAAAASPASATTGFLCRTAGPTPIALALVVSHTAVPAVVSARLTDKRREVPIVTAQSWFDPRELRADLVDRNATRHEARLRAVRRGAAYDGSLWRNGRKHWIRCRES